MEYTLSYGKVYADCVSCSKTFIVDEYTNSFCNYCSSTLAKRVA
jgi:DNA-directed RNA polymerase subunit RPC12/RpoP